jgi:hypothetical protein
MEDRDVGPSGLVVWVAIGVVISLCCFLALVISYFIRDADLLSLYVRLTM